MIALAQGAYQEAYDHILQFQRENSLSHRFMYQANGVMGLAARGLRQREQAWNCSMKELNSAIEHHSNPSLGLSVCGLTLLLHDQEEAGLAEQAYTVIASHPFFINSHWARQITGEKLDQYHLSILGESKQKMKRPDNDSSVWEMADSLYHALKTDCQKPYAE